MRRYQLDTSIKELTPAERAERGRQLRSELPRSSHAELGLPAAPRDPIQELIGQSAGREADLIPIRYGRMLASPFSYFRGAALPMAKDLAATPVTGLAVQVCGDAHVGNFGLFGTAERRLVFDINDFDETLPGPWEWDVKRLAASLEIAARDNGIKPRQRTDRARRGRPVPARDGEVRQPAEPGGLVRGGRRRPVRGSYRSNSGPGSARTR